jgi:dihydroorotase
MALTGARLHVCHISTQGSVELVRHAKRKGLRISAEVTPHHLTLNEERVLDYDTNAKVNPPLRTKKDILALIEGLKDGTIDAIATDHAPHTRVEKLVEFASAPFGVSGLETALASLLRLVREGQIDLPLLISKMSCEPAVFLGLESGTLKVGSQADLLLLDPAKEWTVDPDSFASKGKNTPLAGQKLKGRVVMTFYRGNPVYKETANEQ